MLLNEWMNEWMKEGRNERTNERMSQWMNEILSPSTAAGAICNTIVAWTAVNDRDYDSGNRITRSVAVCVAPALLRHIECPSNQFLIHREGNRDGQRLAEMSGACQIRCQNVSDSDVVATQTPAECNSTAAVHYPGTRPVVDYFVDW